MSYVRSILPPGAEPLWARLGQTIEIRQSTGPRLWRALNDKLEGRKPSAE